MRSLDYAARVQDVPSLVSLPEKVRDAGIPGGTYPGKIDNIMTRFAPSVKYWQDTAKDVRLLSAMWRSKRLVCATYNGHDPHYKGEIAHVVNVVAADSERNWFAIFDNNYPRLDEIVWMREPDFMRRWSGWSYGLFAATPGHDAAPHEAAAEYRPKWRADAFAWRREPSIPGEIALFSEGNQLGSYRVSEDSYFARPSQGVWEQSPSAPPVPAPESKTWPGVKEEGLTNFGLIIDRLPKHPSAEANRVPMTADEILSLIGPEMVPAKPDAPVKPGGGLDLTKAIYGVPLWVFLVAIVVFLLLIFRGEE